MSIENTSTIAGLVATNPTQQDPVYQGPNHFWTIKSVLKNIFPGVGGQGFAKPITATEDELNRVAGVTAPLQSQINALQAQIDALESGGGGGGGGGGTPIPEQWPIGSIFHCTLATSPATLLGFGTWSRFGQGRMLVSQSTSDSDFALAGATGGSKTPVLPAHTHTATTASANTGHSHTISSASDHSHTATVGGMSANATHAHTATTGSMSANASHTHSASTSIAGDHIHGTGTEIHPASTDELTGPSTNYIAYNASGTLNSRNAGDHTHTVTVQSTTVDHTHSLTTASANIDHSHSISFSSGGAHSHTIGADTSSHTHTITVASAGIADGKSLPPYVVVYMWQRIA